MTSSKQQFPLFFLLFFLFLFPLQHAANPRKCSSSYSEPLRCRPSEVPIRFPLCGHKGFNLRCNVLKKTIIELPMSGTFLVEKIDYGKQQISIKDPEKCLAKRLLNLNISGSPFSHRFDMIYTFLACPNEAVLPTWSPSIPCLRNSTTTFFATPNYTLAQSMLPSCQIVRRLHALANSLFKEIGFSSYLINDVSFLLEWDTPNCKGCEAESLRCGILNKASLEVICIVAEGSLSNKSIVIITCVSLVGGVIFFNVCLGCIGCYMYNSEGSDSPRQRIAAIEAAAALAPQPRGTIVRTGLDQSTIESYKKMELGESRRLPETNGIVCPICLSEYASKETVRFIPECNHCFHVDCIDVWLKIHGSCPLCRSSHA